MTKTVIINGTNSDASRVNGIRDYIASKVSNIQTINVYELPAQALITADFNDEAVKKANKIVEEAAHIIVLTPVYKAAYTGILKTYLDLLPQKGLENKTILPIAVGGSSHHLLAIDYALKPVLGSLGATNILQGTYILDKYIERKGDGLAIEQEILDRIDHQLEILEQ